MPVIELTPGEGAQVQADYDALDPAACLSDYGLVVGNRLLVMRWALAQVDPQDWSARPVARDADDWIADNDGAFKAALDRWLDTWLEHPLFQAVMTARPVGAGAGRRTLQARGCGRAAHCVTAS